MFRTTMLLLNCWLWGSLTVRAQATLSHAASPLSVGLGYYTILPEKLLLASVVGEHDTCTWTLINGPGPVTIERPHALVTWAVAQVPGRYVFTLEVAHGTGRAAAEVAVNVYPPGTYTGNPILPGMFPDPHILFDQGRFYIYATSMENAAGAYGQASVWVSEDFVNWNMTLTNWPVFGQFNGDIWAPDILNYRGRYYQFITRSGGYDTWIGVAESPMGPWRNLREDNTPVARGVREMAVWTPARAEDATCGSR